MAPSKLCIALQVYREELAAVLDTSDVSITSIEEVDIAAPFVIVDCYVIYGIKSVRPAARESLLEA